MSVNISVEHDGKTYSAEVMTIESADLGYTNDHGIFDVAMTLKGDGTGVSFGGYALDDRPSEGAKGRPASAYGMDFIMQILSVCEVEKWSQLRGKSILALYPTSASQTNWGKAIQGIANLHGTKVFDPTVHAESWLK